MHRNEVKEEAIYATALPDRIRMRNVFVKQVTGQAARVEASGDRRMGKERLRFGPEEKRPINPFGITERLLAHPVASQGQPLAGDVPDRQGEHPVELADEFGAVILVKMDQAFGVGAGPEGVTSGEESGSKLGIVVDLAVEGDPDGPVLVAHRLGPPLDVDDREPTMPEPGRTFAEQAIAVRPPMLERRGHSGQQRAVGSFALAIHESGNATHEGESKLREMPTSYRGRRRDLS